MGDVLKIGWLWWMRYVQPVITVYFLVKMRAELLREKADKILTKNIVLRSGSLDRVILCEWMGWKG